MAPGLVQVAVVGPGEATPQTCELTREVGRLLAAGGAVVVTGGPGDVMDTACSPTATVQVELIERRRAGRPGKMDR